MNTSASVRRPTTIAQASLENVRPRTRVNHNGGAWWLTPSTCGSDPCETTIASRMPDAASGTMWERYQPGLWNVPITTARPLGWRPDAGGGPNNRATARTAPYHADAVRYAAVAMRRRVSLFTGRSQGGGSARLRRDRTPGDRRL